MPTLLSHPSMRSLRQIIISVDDDSLATEAHRHKSGVNRDVSHFVAAYVGWFAPFRLLFLPQHRCLMQGECAAAHPCPENIKEGFFSSSSFANAIDGGHWDDIVKARQRRDRCFGTHQAINRRKK